MPGPSQLLELIKNFGAETFRDSGPIIGDGDLNAVFEFFQPHRHNPLFTGKLDGIGHQVADQAFNLVWIRAHLKIFRVNPFGDEALIALADRGLVHGPTCAERSAIA